MAKSTEAGASVEIFSRCSAEREKHAQYPGKTERFAQYVFSSGSDSREVGIKDVRALRILGAKMCWLRLRQQNSLVTEKILFMLEGAIIGIHEAALPVARRQELAEWADSLTPKQEFPAELE